MKMKTARGIKLNDETLRSGSAKPDGSWVEVPPIDGFFVVNIGNGRGERVRTSDLRVPNAALYQAELLPEARAHQ